MKAKGAGQAYRRGEGEEDEAALGDAPEGGTRVEIRLPPGPPTVS